MGLTHSAAVQGARPYSLGVAAIRPDGEETREPRAGADTT
jgi:hypothetical protein